MDVTSVYFPEGDIGGIEYDNGYHHLTRIDFHSGSEHTFKGVHLPLEIQLTHQKKNSDSKIIVSILAEAPDELKPEEPAPALLERRAHTAHTRNAHGTHKRQVPDGFHFNEPPNPNEDNIERDLGLSEADEDGMAEVVLGPRPDAHEMVREDMAEISFVKKLDMGANWTADHPDFDVQSAPSNLRKSKIRPATVGPFGLVGSSSNR